MSHSVEQCLNALQQLGASGQAPLRRAIFVELQRLIWAVGRFVLHHAQAITAVRGVRKAIALRAAEAKPGSADRNDPASARSEENLEPSVQISHGALDAAARVLADDALSLPECEVGRAFQHFFRATYTDGLSGLPVPLPGRRPANAVDARTNNANTDLDFREGSSRARAAARQPQGGTRAGADEKVEAPARAKEIKGVGAVAERPVRRKRGRVGLRNARSARQLPPTATREREESVRSEERRSRGRREIKRRSSLQALLWSCPRLSRRT